MANVSLRLTARQWATIDAVLDNAARNAVDLYGDPQPMIDIRHAGWGQVPWVGEQKDWPPMDEFIVIDLDRDQWNLAASLLVEDIELLADLDEPEEQSSGRAALQAIREHLNLH